MFTCTLGASLLAMLLPARLPKHHLGPDSKDAVIRGIGLIATMTALVLGLITASAKGAFDSVESGVKQFAIDLLALDRLLARYGPETGEIRTALKHAVGERLELVWPQDSSRVLSQDPMGSVAVSGVEGLVGAIRGLKPGDDSGRAALQSRAVNLAEALLTARWLVIAATGKSIPLPLVLILLFWLMITFASFGLFAPRNALVVTVFVVCALSVASAIFFILEMDGPFEGLLKVSADPLRRAYAHLNQ